jgi:release factor glutamine methyltransferase
MTAGEALRHASQALARAGIDHPALEARLLLAHALGVDRSVLVDRGQVIDPAPFLALLDRRLAHEPLAFITGRQGFWTLDLAVSPATLIPRADSETLITAAIAARPAGDVRRILDLGTGTGCLLLAALVEFPRAFGIGVDLSPDAVALAARNARESGLADRAALLAGSWDLAIAGRFDLVLSNPPYIPQADIADLMPEVALHEPARALDGGADGLSAYRAILTALPRLLAPDGVAILELGAGQAEPVTALAVANGLEKQALCQDLGGIARALVLKMQKTFGSTRSGR